MCKVHAWLNSCRERLYRDGVIDHTTLTNKKTQFLEFSQSENFCVVCAVGATMASKPQNFVGYLQGVILGLLICPSSIRVRNRNSYFGWNSVNNGRCNGLDGVLRQSCLGSHLTLGLVVLISSAKHLCNLKNYKLNLLHGPPSKIGFPKVLTPLGFGFSTLQNPIHVMCLLHVCSCSFSLIMGVFLQSPQHDLGHSSNHVA